MKSNWKTGIFSHSASEMASKSLVALYVSVSKSSITDALGLNYDIQKQTSKYQFFFQKTIKLLSKWQNERKTKKNQLQNDFLEDWNIEDHYKL